MFPETPRPGRPTVEEIDHAVEELSEVVELTMRLDLWYQAYQLREIRDYLKDHRTRLALGPGG